MLQDPLGHQDSPERTVWYQSKHYRVNLHFRGDQFYLRDIHVYDDRFPEQYKTEPVRQHGIEQRMLAVLDGYHWSDDEVHAGRAGIRAQGRFALIDQHGTAASLAMVGLPTVSEVGATLRTSVPLSGGGQLVFVFGEREIEFRLIGAQSHLRLGLIFDWMADRSAFQAVSGDRLNYRFRNFDYSVGIANGVGTKTAGGVSIVAGKSGALRLLTAQLS
jgi:hypothetical protein